MDNVLKMSNQVTSHEPTFERMTIQRRSVFVRQWWAAQCDVMEVTTQVANMQKLLICIADR